MSTITKIINTLRERYVADGKAASFYEINNGICDEFADDVCREVRDVLEIEALTNEHFTCGGDFADEKWDADLLERAWHIMPPEGMTWDDLSRIDFGQHDWIHSDGLHYDAECAEGVQSFFDLPIFKRCISSSLAD